MTIFKWPGSQESVPVCCVRLYVIMLAVAKNNVRFVVIPAKAGIQNLDPGSSPNTVELRFIWSRRVRDRHPDESRGTVLAFRCIEKPGFRLPTE